MMLVLAIMLSVGATSAEWRPFKEAQVMRGATAGQKFVFHSAGAGESWLDLDLRVSNALDPQRSVVTVEVDSVPRYSSRLRNLQRRIDLGLLNPGFHRVTIRARLVIPEDPCLEYFESEAWVTIEPSTTVHSPLGASSLQRTINDAISQWGQGADVMVVPPRRLEPETLLAIIQTNHWLRRLGHAPVLDSRGQEVPKVHVLLAADDELHMPADVHAQWKRLPGAAGSLLMALEGELFIIGSSPRSLLEGVLQVQRKDTLQLCGYLIACWLPGSNRNPPPTDKEADRDTATAFYLSDVGWPLGFEAQGMGTHRLNFFWQKPAQWKIDRFPELELVVRRPENLHPGVAQKLHVSLNERKLGSWDLEKFAPGETALRVRVPRDQWLSDDFSFEVLADFTPKSRGSCTAEHGRGPWVSVGSRSRFVVERSQTIASGIASFFAQTLENPPTLRWSAGHTWPKAFTLATFLFPWARRRIVEWSFTLEGEPVCNHVVQRCESQAFTEQLSRRLESTEDRSLPLLDHRQHLTVQFRDSGRGKQTLTLCGGEEVPLHEAPDLTQLHSDLAIWNGTRWTLAPSLMAGARMEIRRANVKLASPRAQSEHEQLHKRANRVWMAATALMICGLLWYWGRRPRGRLDPRSVESMRPEEQV